MDEHEQRLFTNTFPRDMLDAIQSWLDGSRATLDVHLDDFDQRDRQMDAPNGVGQISDPIEAAAQIQAGPALHVVHAFAHACNAAQIDAERLRAELRSASSSWPS